MRSEILADLDGEDERAVAAHVHAYRSFAQAFEYPDDARCAALGSGALVDELRAAAALGGGDLAAVLDWEALAEVGAEDALAIEYTRLFDAGAGGPPCSLNGGIYGDTRMKTMEEATRFYNHFELRLEAEGPARELPDHLTVQLEFLHYLAYREAQAMQSGADPGAYQRARRDFIDRHPAAWLPKLRARLESTGAMPFFKALTDGLMLWLDWDRRDLVTRIGSAPAGTASTTQKP